MALSGENKEIMHLTGLYFKGSASLNLLSKCKAMTVVIKHIQVTACHSPTKVALSNSFSH